MVEEANRRARHAPRSTDFPVDSLLLAEIACDLHYLVHTCPTTKLACQKLAALRAAVRALGPVEEAKTGGAP